MKKIDYMYDEMKKRTDKTDCERGELKHKKIGN